MIHLFPAITGKHRNEGPNTYNNGSIPIDEIFVSSTLSLKNAGLSEAKYLEMIKSEANLKQISMPYSLNEIYDDKMAGI